MLIRNLVKNYCKNFKFIQQQQQRNFSINNQINNYRKFSKLSSQQQNSLIYIKWLSIGSLIIGVPYLFYNYKLKSKNINNNHNQLNQNLNTNNDKNNENEIKNKKIENLPEHVPYLIVGGGPSGFSAARTIRGNDSKSRVLIVTDENHYPYTRTPLTKELWFSGLDENQLSFKQFNGKERSIYFEHEEFYLPLNEFNDSINGGISVLKQHKIIFIDFIKRFAKLDNEQIINYDKCIIATGSIPKKLDCIEKNDKNINEKIIYYRYPEDYQKINNLLTKLNSITIVGNNFVASELAFSLIERSKKLKSNVKINHIFEQNGILNEILPEYLSNWCTDRIKAENINVINNVKIENIKLNNNNNDKKNELILKLSNGQTINTDICIVDLGLQPNNELGINSNIEIDTNTMGLMANSELQLQKNLWSCGDVVSYYDQKYHKRQRNYYHDNAIYTGRLAGDNASKTTAKIYSHYTRFWSDLGADIGFEAIGNIDSKLQTFSMFTKFFQNDYNNNNNDNDQYKYEKGVIFYLNDDKIIVGIILWNIFDVDNMYIARRILSNGMKEKDLNDVAKLFSLYPLSSLPTTSETLPSLSS